MLTAKIQQDLFEALKRKDGQKVATLRFIQSKIKNVQIDKKEDLTDGDVVQVIRKQIKELKEAAELFEKGGREDLVDQNKAQIKILSVYLPAEISDEELETEIQKIIREKKELYDKNPKAIIGIAMAKLKSKADPKRIITKLQSHQKDK